MAWRHFVAIGDSLTAGTGDPFEGIEHLSWTDRLARAFAPLHPDFQYHNLAVRGKTTVQMIAEQLPAALDLRPDLVSIMAGGNDIAARVWTPEQFRAELAALVEPLRASGATVFVSAMIDNWESLPPQVRDYQRIVYERLRAVNRVVRDVAAEYGLLLLDFERVTHLHGMEMISADWIHANSLGYVKIAAEAARQLSALTGVHLSSPALNVPDAVLEKHRVFREILNQLDHSGSAVQELVS